MAATHIQIPLADLNSQSSALMPFANCSARNLVSMIRFCYCHHLLYTKEWTGHGVSSAKPGIATHGDSTHLSESIWYIWCILDNNNILSATIYCMCKIVLTLKWRSFADTNCSWEWTKIENIAFANPNTRLLCPTALFCRAGTNTCEQNNALNQSTIGASMFLPIQSGNHQSLQWMLWTPWIDIIHFWSRIKVRLFFWMALYIASFISAGFSNGPVCQPWSRVQL